MNNRTSSTSDAQENTNRIGILLAGGTGSRLYPLTIPVNKQLLPVYDKPMVYYPLSTLMFAGIKDIIVVTSPDALAQFKDCLGNGRQWGINLDYAVQPKPEGIPQALTIVESAIRNHSTTLILGDNLLYGSGLPASLRDAGRQKDGATIFAYPVSNPNRFGVVTLNKKGEPTAIDEKPARPRSNLAIPGLYFYDKNAVDMAKSLRPSPRGELEITDLNKMYMKANALKVYKMGRGWAWLDGGTHDALYDAGQFVRVIEERTGLKIACLEETAYYMGYIGLDALWKSASTMPESSYGNYLRALIAQEEEKTERPLAISA